MGEDRNPQKSKTQREKTWPQETGGWRGLQVAVEGG